MSAIFKLDMKFMQNKQLLKVDFILVNNKYND